MRKNVLFIIFFLISISVSAQSVSEIFLQANKLYESENYTGAIDLYEKIIASGYESGELYYNLGNAYFKSKKIGNAILNYERAKRLIPNDDDVKTNLQIANLNIVDKITPLPQLFFTSYLLAFRDFFGINTLSWLCLSLYILVIIMGIFYIWTRNQRALFLGSGVSILLLVFVIFLGWAIYDRENNIEAVLLIPKFEVRGAPDENSTELFILHEGVKVKILREIDDWVEIKLADGKIGWMKKGILGII
jgi:tetratricopeptide (TPR) repeat protein